MAKDNSYDCIVVGAGPGGSTAASFLGRMGKKVLLIEKEKFPRDKTCGDAISGKSLGILGELGLVGAIENSPHGEIGGVLFSSTNGTVAKIPFGGEGKIERGYTCRRQLYDNLLFENAKQFCSVLEEMEVLGLAFESGKVVGVRAKGKDGKEHKFLSNLVIGADGVGSSVARDVRGAEADPKHSCIAYRAYYSDVGEVGDFLEIHFVKSIMPGYFWIFPLEEGLANVGVGMVMEDVRKKKVNLGAEMERIVRENPLFKKRFENAKQVSPIKAWRLPFGSKKRKVHSQGVLLVGDAAGLVDPFSGEGVGNAMLSGKIAAEVASKAIEEGNFSAERLAEYESRLWGELWGELSTSYQMQRLGRYAPLLDFIIGKAARSEKARQAIAGTISNKEKKKEYSSPLFYLKLLLE